MSVVSYIYGDLSANTISASTIAIKNVSTGSTSDQLLVRASDGSVKAINQPQYLEYRATLTQTGTTAPIATALGDITLTEGSWSYNDVGSYFFNKTGAFSASTKVEVDIQSAQVYAYAMSNGAFSIISASVYNDDSIEIRTSYWTSQPISGSTAQVLTPGNAGPVVSDAMSNDILNNTRFVVRIWS